MNNAEIMKIQVNALTPELVTELVALQQEAERFFQYSKATRR